MTDDGFLTARDRLLASGLLGDELICKAGRMNGRVLKLLKTSWTNDDHRQIRNTSGVFFSVWESPHRLLYNIHALKMRHLQGYRLESRKFAAGFRAEFVRHAPTWPNVRTDFGPLTLMQGWIERRDETLAEDIYGLAVRFLELVPLVDGLLDVRYTVG